jgi:hypothetical protein
VILTGKQQFDRIGKARALGLRAQGRSLSHFIEDRIETRSFTISISTWFSWVMANTIPERFIP